MDYPDGATPLDPDELNGLKFKHVTTRGELDQLEQANIIEGLSWLNKQKAPDILTIEFSLRLHKELFGQIWNWAGSFRTSEKNIGVDPITISVSLKLLLDDTEYWIEHETYHPLEIAARFHHRLVAIHLFANGNGRHARILTDALLKYKLEHAPIDWSGGHSLTTMSERRSEYIAALRQADQSDYRALLTFVGRGE